MLWQAVLLKCLPTKTVKGNQNAFWVLFTHKAGGNELMGIKGVSRSECSVLCLCSSSVYLTFHLTSSTPTVSEEPEHQEEQLQLHLWTVTRWKVLQVIQGWLLSKASIASLSKTHTSEPVNTGADHPIFLLLTFLIIHYLLRTCPIAVYNFIKGLKVT